LEGTHFENMHTPDLSTPSHPCC